MLVIADESAPLSKFMPLAFALIPFVAMLGACVAVP